MRSVMGFTLYSGFVLAFLISPQAGFGQACKDQETMVTDYENSIKDLTDAVKKETLPDFERAYHQKNAITKLTLFDGIVDGELNCLEKAESDATATKEQLADYKAKHDTFSKLKERVQKDRDAVKSTEAQKDAKALIEKIDYSK